jgi:ActR/RegA family two-component response regulator
MLVFELSAPDMKRDSESHEVVSEPLAHLRVRAALPATLTPPAPGAPAAPPARIRRPGVAPPSPALEIVTHLLAENGARFQIDDDCETFGATLLFAIATADAQSVALRTTPPRGHETVMVVEDDGAVRTLMRTTLERHGYRVMVAQGPRDALAAARAASPAIDLVIVVLVLPDARGDALAAEMQMLRAGVRVLYTSGQPDRLAADQPVLTPAGILLAKPFTTNRLLLGVRQALDTTPIAPPPSASS